jgi:hypothetical protein
MMGLVPGDRGRLRTRPLARRGAHPMAVRERRTPLGNRDGRCGQVCEFGSVKCGNGGAAASNRAAHDLPAKWAGRPHSLRHSVVQRPSPAHLAGGRHSYVAKRGRMRLDLRLRGRCSASTRAAPVGFSLLTLGAASAWSAPGGSGLLRSGASSVQTDPERSRRTARTTRRAARQGRQLGCVAPPGTRLAVDAHPPVWPTWARSSAL